MPLTYFVFSTVHAVQMTKQGPPANPFAMQVPLGAFGDLPGFDVVLWIFGAVCVVLALFGGFAVLATRSQMEPAEAG